MSTCPLLTVKRVAPPERPSAVRRESLEERLRTADGRLTVVVAPAGWGKTSLLAGWAGREPSVAWVSLDEGDDEPVRFWRYVLTSLGEAGDGLGAAALGALLAPGTAPVDLAIPLLLNELATSSRRHVLVLDDYHLLGDARIHEGVEFLLSYLPPTLRIVLAARADPPLPLARMRARGELTEIRAADLGFSVAETAELVAAVSGTAVDDDEARAIRARTEGWPAGLQLTALGRRPRSEGAPRPSDRRHVLDYLAEEVLPGLAPAQRELLVATAPLARLSGPLCDAVLDTAGSADVLDELDRADLFVVPLDEDREWYRCHALLRDALLREPRPAGAARAVLVRAGHWFAEHGRFDDAADHLLLGSDAEAAAALLGARWSWFLERGSAVTYVLLGDRLPAAVVSPTLALSLAYASATSGRSDRVRRWLDVCDARLGPEDVVEGWRSARGAAVMLRAMLGTPDSAPGERLRLAQEAIRIECSTGAATPSPPALAGLGTAYASDGRFSEAAPILIDAWAQRDAGVWTRDLSLQLAGLLGLVLGELDRDEELDRLVLQAGAMADAVEGEWGAAALPMLIGVRIVEGRHAYRRGRTEQARRLLARAVEAEAGRASLLVVALTFLAEAELAGGARPAARAALARARDVVDDGEPVLPFAVEWLGRAERRIGRAAARSAHSAGALPETLTDRELSILRLLPGSASQREIAAALFLSINTVKAYTKSLYRKLGVASRHDAVAVARSLGLI